MFSQAHLVAYHHAGGWAVTFEFIVRACAESLFESGTKRNLEGMYGEIVDSLRPFLTPQQLTYLDEVNLCDLRDDIVHSRLSKAFGKLGGKSNDPSVATVTSLQEGEEAFAWLTRAMNGGRPIVQTKTQDAGVAMWLVQMATSGFFLEAARRFQGGCAILHQGMAAWRIEVLADVMP